MEEMTMIKDAVESMVAVFESGANTSIDLTEACAKVAAAREKGTSDKRYMSQISALLDMFREDILNTSFAAFEKMMIEIENDEDAGDLKKLLEFVKAGVDKLIKETLDWGAEVQIAGATLTIDSVLHPSKVKTDKKHLEQLRSEVKVTIYSEIIEFIDNAKNFLSSIGHLDDLPEEIIMISDYILSVCEENITLIRSQISGKTKKNPIIRNAEPDQVKQLAKSTEEAARELRRQQVDILGLAEVEGPVVGANHDTTIPFLT